MIFFKFDRKLLLIKLHYFLGIAASAPITPFLSTILKQRGYSSVVVGTLFTVLPLPGLLIRPVIGVVTDKYKCRKKAIVLNACFMFMLVCGITLTPEAHAAGSKPADADVVRSPVFWLFAGLVVLFSTASVIKTVLEDTICVDLLGKDRHKYGKQRMWGAIGWGTFSIVSGLCVDWFSKGEENKNYTPGFIISLICMILDIYVLSKIEVVQNNNSESAMCDFKKVFKQIKVIAFFFWVVCFGIFCAFIWYYVFWYLEDLSYTYHPETKPWIKTIQGFSLTVQCFGGEVPFFFLSSFIFKRVDHMNVFSIMFFTFAVRFFLYSIIRNPIWVIPVELLNGITFALAYTAAISYAAHVAPLGAEGMLQGFVGMALTGIGTPIGSFLGGCLFRRFGSIISFKLLSGTALAVCVVQIIVTQLINRISEGRKSKEESCQIEPINRKLLSIKLHYFLGVAATAPISAFLTTILKQRGYSSTVVGTLFTVLPLPGLLIRPVVGVVTDKYKCRKTAIILNACVMFVLVCGMVLAPGASAAGSELADADVVRSPVFWLFAGVVMSFVTANTIRAVLEDTICVDLLGEDRHQYGKQRMWGAVGWGTMSIVSGLCVDWFSKGQDDKNYLPGFIISLICMVFDIYVLSKIEINQNNNSVMAKSDIKKVFKQIKAIAFLFWVMCFGFFCAFIWYYVFWYLEDLSNVFHPETKPWIKTIQGFSLTVQCFGGEVPFFFLSSFILKRVDHMNVFSIMFFTFAVRFFLYSIIRNPIWVLPVELLNGITYALAYSAAISYAAHLAPPGAEGVLQGIVGTAQMGIGTPIGSFLGGCLFRRFGSIISFKLLSGIALAVCVVQVIVTQLIKCKEKSCQIEPAVSNLGQNA